MATTASTVPSGPPSTHVQRAPTVPTPSWRMCHSAYSVTRANTALPQGRTTTLVSLAFHVCPPPPLPPPSSPPPVSFRVDRRWPIVQYAVLQNQLRNLSKRSDNTRNLCSTYPVTNCARCWTIVRLLFPT